MALYPSNFATTKRNPPPNMLEGEIWRAKIANDAATQDRAARAQTIGAVGSGVGTGIDAYGLADYGDAAQGTEGNKIADWMSDKFGKGSNTNPMSGALRGGVGTGGNVPSTVGSLLPGAAATTTAGSGLGAAGGSVLGSAAPASIAAANAAPAAFLPGAAAATTAGSGLGAAGTAALGSGAAMGAGAGAGAGAAAAAPAAAAMGPPGWIAAAALAAYGLGAQFDLW